MSHKLLKELGMYMILAGIVISILSVMFMSLSGPHMFAMLPGFMIGASLGLVGLLLAFIGVVLERIDEAERGE